METIKALFSLSFFIVVLTLTGCGGGGSSGSSSGGSFSLDGAAVSGTYDPYATSIPPTYSFNIVAGTPYTVNLVSTSGDAELNVFDADPYTGAAGWIGTSWTSTSTLDQVSFVAAYDGQAYIAPFTFDSSSVSYTVQATSNNLTVDAAAKTASAYNDSLYYSFDAVAGSTYEVILAPSAGDVNIGAVSPVPDLSSSIGSSYNTGTAIDSLYIPVLTTQRYYIRLAATSTDSTFDISVRQVPNDPDLRAVIDNVASDGTNAIVDYTVYNDGANSYVGDFQLDVWSDATTAPTVGSTGEGFTTHSGTVTGLGGSVSGRVTIANTAETGTAYVVVDTIGAVVESNEGNNVSAAVSWVKPILAPVSYDFETEIIPSKTVMSGDANWVIDNSAAGAGSATGSLVSLVSGAITDNQSSCFAFSAYNSQSTNISFDRKVSSESNDRLIFYIDGVQKNSWGGDLAWANVSYNTSSGQHEYKWCYTKDSIAALGTDQAWIDNIDIVSVPADLRVVINSASSNGTDVTINYTVYNDTSVPIGVFAIDFWSDAASAPTVGATGETTASHNAGLAGWGSASGTVIIPNSAISGTAYAVVDTTDAVLETDETDNVSAGVAWALPDLSVVITNTVATGTNIIVSYTVTNSGSGDATAFNVDVWEDAASAPVIGDVGSSSVSITSLLAAGASVSGSVSIASAITSGTAYAIVDTNNSIIEVDETNNVSTGFALVVPLVAYDFEADSTVPVAFVMSGITGWALDSTNGAGGSTTSLVSGTITDDEISCTATTVSVSSFVSFDYNVSSEVDYDYLRFYIDGVQQDSWSGTVAWANVSYTVATGSHEYKWCYTKDGSVSSGSDAVWIDNIIIN
ncbi:MAG: hypothetical protein KAT06_12715 [Gammaproteobacteria bacterium]|nr:hypothetical protein [Gammaproteobacteria bacterium]